MVFEQVLCRVIESKTTFSFTSRMKRMIYVYSRRKLKGPLNPKRVNVACVKTRPQNSSGRIAHCHTRCPTRSVKFEGYDRANTLYGHTHQFKTNGPHHVKNCAVKTQKNARYGVHTSKQSKPLKCVAYKTHYPSAPMQKNF